MTTALRPLAPQDFDALWAARDPAGRSAAGAERLERQIERSGRLLEGRLDLAVVDGERLVGTIEARQPHGALPEGCFEIGIGLFATHDRGRGHGTRAVELMTQRLFDEHGAERVQASTWVENTAMRRVLEKLGFAFEGVMRGFWPDGGAPRQDFALYAVLRRDWAQTRR
jgi:RimJ/RimL family protein N-acetyltransferase